MVSDVSTYKLAGVDITAADHVKTRMGPAIRSTFGPRVLTDVGPLGGFGGLYSIDRLGVPSPVLVGSADGVGTKLKIAFLLEQHATLGLDLVNHCLNDVLTTGADPLFFMDYFATSDLRPEVALAVVTGIAEACRFHGISLLGGETAQMPGFYQSGEYDLAGFMVGVVARDAILGPERVRCGDSIVGLPSSGLHTNGYSLARRVFALDGDPVVARRRLAERVPDLGRTLGEELLEPHRSYRPVLREHISTIHALAHITGGGLIENPPRAIKEDLAIRLDASKWDEPPIFNLIQRIGRVPQSEMDRTFNRGLGMLAFVAPEHGAQMVESIPGATIVGEVIQRIGDDAVEVIR